MDCLHRRRVLTALTLGAALALAAPFPVAGMDLDVFGIDGADGEDGTLALPNGVPGFQGNAASATVSSADATNTATATGGRGGTGGSGFGTGAGGAGGKGGSASATAETIAPGSATTVTSAIAAGGDGGEGGAGSVVGLGGDGGVASSSASATGGGTVTVSASATGGDGGDAGGPARGGAAGEAHLGLVTGTSTGGGTVTVTGVQVGGAGGESYNYPNIAPAGADSFVTDKVSGETTGTLILKQDAFGGSGGGKTDYGSWLGGKGGDAASRLASTSSSANVTGSVLAKAGNGGSSSYIGGNGGSAAASISLQAPGDVQASAVAVGGGPGRYPTSGDDMATPGYGGGASLGPVFGRSTGGGEVTVSGLAQGGDRSGSGVSLSNAVDGETSGDLTLSQSAIGGSSWSRYGWDYGGTIFAGSGYSALIKTDADFDVAPSSLTLNAFAEGGLGNYGGKGGSGRGGDATAIADAMLSTTPVVARAVAVGGGYVGDLTFIEYFVTGGSASASAHSNTQAEALAIGGAPDAGATADAVVVGNGLRTASANASALASTAFWGVNVPGRPNGTSTAVASNTSGQSAEAISQASGRSASAIATASTSSNEYVSLVAAGANTTLDSQDVPSGGGIVGAQARTATGSLLGDAFPQTVALSATADAVAKPSAGFLTPRLTSSPTVAARYDLADANSVTGWGHLGASSYSSDWLQYADGVSRLDFTIDAAMFLAQGGTAGRLLVGLFNPFLSKQSGSDQLIRFDILEDGLSVLPGGEASFTESAGLESYFADKVLDLGAWQDASWFSPGETTLDLAFILAASGGRLESYPISFASFSTEFVFGLSGGAVPEPVPLPAAFWLFGSGAAAVLGLARRRRAGETGAP